MDTPRLTRHARRRCAEMGVGTKRAKRIVQSPDVRRPSGGGALIATRNDEPKLAVVYVEQPAGAALITSVLWKNADRYVRLPGGYEVIGDERGKAC